MELLTMFLIFSCNVLFVNISKSVATLCSFIAIWKCIRHLVSSSSYYCSSRNIRKEIPHYFQCIIFS